MILDTEGLFSILSKKDSFNRESFDRKLTLFCLSVSDYVIINTKGDLEKNIKDIITVCLKSLLKLE